MGSLGTSFGTAAGDYQRGRPGYLPDAVAWLLAGVTGPVADVGAGTGKLTAEIARQGFDVTAVDPDPEMLQALSAGLPAVPTAIGSAESLPLETASQGAVTFGQSWHWVDVDAASAEVERVLRPGGVIGLIWNVRDESVDWVAALGDAMGSSRAESIINAFEVEVTAGFGDLEERVWRWENPMTADDLIAMVRSRSYYIVGDETYRAGVDQAVNRVISTLDPAAILMPYATHAFRATRS